MARSMWKGAISFGLVHIPVEMYPAVTNKGLDLNMLDRRDFSPIDLTVQRNRFAIKGRRRLRLPGSRLNQVTGRCGDQSSQPITIARITTPALRANA